MSSIAVFSLLSLLILSFSSWLLVRGVIKVSKHMSWKHSINKWIVIVYFGVLLLSVIVYEILPENGEKVTTENEIQLLREENEAFEEALRKGEVSKLDSKFLVEEWTRELEGNTLTIVSSDSNISLPKVYVEWIDSKEQYVEGKVYQTNINMYGINLDEKVPKMNIELKDERIVIGEQIEKELRFYTFSNDLAIFAGVPNFGEHRSVHGQTYIHLKVPKHINVIDELGLQFY